MNDNKNTEMYFFLIKKIEYIFINVLVTINDYNWFIWFCNF